MPVLLLQLIFKKSIVTVILNSVMGPIYKLLYTCSLLSYFCYGVRFNLTPVGMICMQNELVG